MIPNDASRSTIELLESVEALTNYIKLGDGMDEYEYE